MGGCAALATGITWHDGAVAIGFGCIGFVLFLWAGIEVAVPHDL